MDKIEMYDYCLKKLDEAIANKDQYKIAFFHALTCHISKDQTDDYFTYCDLIRFQNYRDI